MPRRTFDTEQIIGILAEHEAGLPADGLYRKYGIDGSTLAKWKAKYGGLEPSDIAGLDALDQQRARGATPAMAALHAADKQHIRLSYVVAFYFNKDDNSTLIDLLRKYETYAPALLDRIQFIVVDDGSPLTFDIPDFHLNLTWLRITEDIPWNLGGARNLGVVYAKSDTIVLADLDHEFPQHTLEACLARGNLGRTIYRFRRQSRATGKIEPLAHANSFLMSRGRFLRFYGYDEEFRGNYGYVGGWLTDFHRYHGSWVLKFPKRYFIIRNDLPGWERDHDLKRNKVRNYLVFRRKRNELRHWGAEAGHSRLFLDFRWEVVKELRREPRPQPRTDRAWKYLSWLRTFLGTYR